MKLRDYMTGTYEDNGDIEIINMDIPDFIYQIWLKAREGYMMDVKEDLQTAVKMIDGR